MSKPAVWRFNESEAEAAAHEVVHHEPDASWTRMAFPASTAAATASVAALTAEVNSWPASVRGAIHSATRNAAQLSDDRLQGLAELLQNADDAGATTGYFRLDGQRLLFGHDGADLSLADVWALTLPWLSSKASDAGMLGRFGIGLKTLQSLSETLEAHNDAFHLKLSQGTLSTLRHEPLWPSQPPYVTTTFVIPVRAGDLTHADLSDWLQSWGDAGLLFLRHLRSVTLIDENGCYQQSAHLDHEATAALNDKHLIRARVVADEHRSWMLYSRTVPSPEGSRAGKARADTTPVAVAFPLFDGDQGHVHVGLPVRPIGLPFRIAGQFDPLANRRDISDTPWNAALLGPMAELWRDAALDMFTLDAATGWSLVPLAQEAGTNPLPGGRLSATLYRSLMREARLAFADAVRVDGGDGSYSLADLAYETPDLTDVLGHNDITALAGRSATIATSARSTDDRWRRVIFDLGELGAETPALVDARSAVSLLDEPTRPTAFVADLTGVVVAEATSELEENEDLRSQLLASMCLVRADGERLSPTDAQDLQVVLPNKSSALWKTLSIGTEVHPDYRSRPGWPEISRWLRSEGLLRPTATDHDALQVLSDAGREDLELSEPLSDEQAVALRAAIEAVKDSARADLCEGIGRAIRLEATVYDRDGSRRNLFARPAEAYLIEKEKGSWAAAAKRAPGLVWLHRRYADVLRAETGRAGLGSQRLFRLLGAESAPRLIKLPDTDDYYKRYKFHRPGLWRGAPGSPARRQRQMDQTHAGCTLEDYASPDLDAVLLSIAAEKNGKLRHVRVDALLICLNRNWDRLEPHVRVKAANPDNGWVELGEVDAWWVNRAASIDWLSNGRGRPAAPSELRLRTLANEAMHGNDPTSYIASGYDKSVNLDVLLALGVEGNPSVQELIDRLAELKARHRGGFSTSRDARDSHPMTSLEAADLAASLYQALAAQVHGVGRHRQLGSLRASVARTVFDRGDGLIITNLGWRRTSVTRSGPAIFGDLTAFVPAVRGATPLWDILGIRAPDAEDARATIRQLSQQTTLHSAERQIMLESLRLIAASPGRRDPQLRRSPVYVGDRWVRRRPVYAVANPLLARALGEDVPVWQPGGPVAQLGTLIEPLGLTSVDGSRTRVQHSHQADYDADLTATFATAVRNLQSDLAVSTAVASEALSLTWDQFAAFQVAVMPILHADVDLPDGASHQVRLASWIDTTTATLFVTSPAQVGLAGSGGHAVASLFDTDPREIAHAWVAAWSDAAAHIATEAVTSAADHDAEQMRRRDLSTAALLGLSVSPESRTIAKKSEGKPRVTPPRTGAQTDRPTQKPARVLVDLDALVLHEAEGQLLEVRSSMAQGPGGTAGGQSRSGGRHGLRDPDRTNPKNLNGPRRGPLNYTAEERESAGLELLRRVMDAQGVTLVDVRHQANVGADAVDDQDRFYELKVSKGPIPDIVKLEDSQIERALKTEHYYLALVGNVEADQGDPEVRIIHDPLHRLRPQPQGAVHLAGVLSAEPARTWKFRLRGSDESNHAAEAVNFT